MTRAVSTVVGVALLVGVTMITLTALTASVGTVIESQADRADTNRVTDAFEDIAAAKTATTGRLAFSEGRVHTADRDLRVLRNGRVVAHEEVDALVYDSGEQRVAILAGAVLRENGASAWFAREPPVTTAESGGPTAVVVGAVGVEGPVTVAGTVDARLRVSVNHTRRSLRGGAIGVAIETETPRPWIEYFREHGATVRRADIDGDGRPSVVGTFGADETHLLVHRVEVTVDG